MLKIDGVINKKYGRLLVVGYSYKKNNRHYFKCLCDCGNRADILWNSLLKGQERCKKCYKGNEHHAWKGYGEISSTIFKRIERDAGLKKIEFNLTIEYLWELFLIQNRKCSLTGVILHFPSTDKQLHKGTASLDKINPQKGYIQGNVQWVHKSINHIKSDIPNEYFILICNLVSKNNQSLLSEADFLNESSGFIKNIRKLKKGAAHHMSKTYELINELGDTKIIKGLENFCNENNLSSDSIKNSFKTGYFHKGWKILRKLES